MHDEMASCARCGGTTSNLRYCNRCSPVKAPEIPPVHYLYPLEQKGFLLDPLSPCPLCGQLKNLNYYCAPCTEAMATVAIAAAKDAPAADWRKTGRETYWTRFHDGQLARVSTQTGLLPLHFSILDEIGKPVVRDDALDADRGRRYAECAHHLLNRLKAAMAATMEGRGDSRQLVKLRAFLEELGADPTLPPLPGGLVYGTMDLAALAYFIDLPACLRCLRYSEETDLCDLCWETLKREALDVSHNAPPVAWHITLHGEYHARFDDGHSARMYSAPDVGETYFALEVYRRELVSDTCPDLATGRRYAECGHWLLHRVDEKRSLTLPTTSLDALVFVTCDLAGLAFLLAQRDPATEGFPSP